MDPLPSLNKTYTMVIQQDPHPSGDGHQGTPCSAVIVAKQTTQSKTIISSMNSPWIHDKRPTPSRFQR